MKKRKKMTKELDEKLGMSMDGLNEFLLEAMEGLNVTVELRTITRITRVNGEFKVDVRTTHRIVPPP